MAKVIQSQQQIIAEPWWAKGSIGYIGIATGVTWWVLTAIIRQYIVEPLACRDLATASACVNAIGVSGSVAAVLVAVVGTILLVRYRQPRPIIIAVATMLLLWDLGALMDGLAWWVTLLWACLLYLTSYVLFSMVARIQWLAAGLTLAAIIVVGIRLLVVL